MPINNKRFRNARAQANYARAAKKRRMLVTQRQAYRPPNVRYGGFLGVENKFYDQYIVSTNAGTTAGTPIILSPQATAAFTLNTVVQGDGESNRDGRAINMLSLHFRANVRLPPQQNLTASVTSASGCIWIILDKQCNGAVPSATDIFSVLGGTTCHDVNLFNNLQFSKRFVVLKKMKYRLGYKAAGYDGVNFDIFGEEISFDKTINLKGMTVNYSGTSENVSNITDNSITVWFVSNSASTPVISWRSRLRFKG